MHCMCLDAYLDKPTNLLSASQLQTSTTSILKSSSLEKNIKIRYVQTLLLKKKQTENSLG